MTKPPISHWLVRRTREDGTLEYLADFGFMDREGAYSFCYLDSARDAANIWSGSKVVAVRKKPGLRARLEAYVKDVKASIDDYPLDGWPLQVIRVLVAFDRDSAKEIGNYWSSKQ